MRVLAIDPGYQRLGIAVLEKQNGQESILYSSCFETSKKEEMSQRLFSIKLEIEKIIKRFKPDIIATEEIYFNKNTKTIIRVAEIKGIIIATGKEKGLETKEINPLRVKTAITGYGRSTKKDIHFMLSKIVDMPKKIMLDDEADAIAIGITCLAENRINR